MVKLKKLLSSTYLIGLLVILLTWGLYFLYLWPNMLFWTENGISTGWVGIWGDWQAHMDYANIFAFQPISHWLNNPIIIGHKLTYPFLADAISGLLMRFGDDRINAFIVPSIITGTFCLIVLYHFYYYLTKSARQAALATTLLLANGGLGFVLFIQDWLKDPANTNLLSPSHEYTHIATQSLEWVNVVTAELIPQRAFLLGLPIALIIIIFIRERYQKSYSTIALWYYGAFGLLTSLMLIIHVHSYMAIAIICACLFASDWRRWPFWLSLGAGAAIGVTLYYSTILQNQMDGSFFRYFPGWMANPEIHQINWLYFWFINLGLGLFLIPWSIWQTKLYKDPLVIAGLILFVLINLFLFQPFSWDNTKLLTWSYLILVWPMAVYIDKLWTQKILGKVLAGLAVIILTASGFLDLSYFINFNAHTFQMWSNADILIAKQFRQISKPTDRVLAGAGHDNWVPTLTGRPVVMGYRGWLWTYGIDYGPIEKDVRTMFEGQSTAVDLLKKYNVRFVVIGDAEREEFRANSEFYRHNFIVILHNNQYTVYQIY